VSDEVTSTAGLIALASGAIGLSALVVAVIASFRLRAVRLAQKAVLGESDERDLAQHALAIQDGYIQLRDLVETTFETMERRLSEHELRLRRGISHAAVVRYDAYGEMTGRQSSSMALLDDEGNGVVLSSILHREQARMYVKDVQEGQSQFELSPEESQAIAEALAPATAQPARAES
jgi:hypothetical protein